MKLYLKNAPRYASEQIMMMLFPQDKPEVVEESFSGDGAVIEITEDSGILHASTKIYKDGMCFEGSDTAKTEGIDDELEIKRRLHQALKISFYRAALPLLPKAPEWGAMTGIRPAKVAAKLFKAGASQNEVDGILKETYYVQPRRRELAIRAALTGIEVEKNLSPRDISIYIGIPFCASRCKYCSFVSHSIDKASHLIEPYIKTLISEMEEVSKTVSEKELCVKTVYIGGGTPTALSTEDLRRVMQALRDNFDLSNVYEYTVEAGRPDTADLRKIKMISEMGATRISVNPQTMDNRVLSLMGRNHTAEDIVRMVSDIRNVSDMLINMDLIAGLPGDSFEGFKDSLNKVISLNPDNITVHTLAIKKGSTLKDEKMQLPPPKEVEKMVNFAFDEVRKAQFSPYYLYRQKYMSGNLENVGYAKSGAMSAYNVLIMEELHTILSFGAGGVTKLVDNENARIERIFNPKYPYEYNKIESFSDTCDKISKFY